MKGGCFRNLFAAIGCGTVLLGGALLAWQYRTPIGRWSRSVIDGRSGDSLPGAGSVPGVPSSDARRSAERKEADMARRDGPAMVTLSRGEMASLIHRRLDPAVRQTMDSVRVTLDDNRLTLEGQILIDVLDLDPLGPLAELLGSRQAVFVAGPVSIREAGVLAWEAHELRLGSVPLPRAAIPRLIDRLTGGSDGAFLIRVPETVEEVRIRPGGVTFYRRVAN